MYFENIVTVNSSRFSYIRMTPERCEHLFSLVGPLITKVNTKMRQASSVAERLTLTLRYLASGDDQQSISFSYRIGKTTVSHIIQETLNAIWKALKDKYVSPPKSATDWKNIFSGRTFQWFLSLSWNARILYILNLLQLKFLGFQLLSRGIIQFQKD